MARELSERENVVLLVLDELLAQLYPNEIVDIAGFITYSSRVKQALSGTIGALLAKQVSVVLDFPGNTRQQRAWFRELLTTSAVDHELHFIDADDDLCKRQLRQRSGDLTDGAAWTREADFDAITAYFDPPAEEEGFNVIYHQCA